MHKKVLIPLDTLKSTGKFHALYAMALVPSFFRFHKTKTKNWNSNYFSPSDEFPFLVFVLMPRILKADFLLEVMTKISNLQLFYLSLQFQPGSGVCTLKSKNLDN